MKMKRFAYSSHYAQTKFMITCPKEVLSSIKKENLKLHTPVHKYTHTTFVREYNDEKYAWINE